MGGPGEEAKLPIIFLTKSIPQRSDGYQISLHMGPKWPRFSVSNGLGVPEAIFGHGAAPSPDADQQRRIKLWAIFTGEPRRAVRPTGWSSPVPVQEHATSGPDCDRLIIQSRKGILHGRSKLTQPSR